MRLTPSIFISTRASTAPRQITEYVNEFTDAKMATRRRQNARKQRYSRLAAQQYFAIPPSACAASLACRRADRIVQKRRGRAHPGDAQAAPIVGTIIGGQQRRVLGKKHLFVSDAYEV